MTPISHPLQTQLTDQLLRLCTDSGVLDGQLLETADLNERCKDILAAYLADAVPEIPSYPLVALGWMVYVGMGVAHLWDTDWTAHANTDLYATLRTPRGFDALDEEVRESVLGMERDGTDYQACEALVRRCAQQALDFIHHAAIEPQSPEAFHAYVDTLTVLYKIGIAIELRRQGYKYEAVPV